MKKFLNTKIKDMKAITLIALVITIVVLIILAAVAISLSLGNYGIFNRAKTAKEQYQNAQDYEINHEYDEDVDGLVEGNRDKVSITKEEYEQLLEDLEEARSKENKIKKVFVGTSNSLAVRKFDVSNIEGYENFTINNFVFDNARICWVNNSSVDNVKTWLKSSYNPDTGILTLNKSGDSGDGWTRYIEYNVYVLVGEIV